MMWRRLKPDESLALSLIVSNLHWYLMQIYCVFTEHIWDYVPFGRFRRYRACTRCHAIEEEIWV